MDIVKAAADHGSAYSNIAALAQLELQELEKNAAKDVATRRKQIEERDRRQEEERRRHLAAQQKDAADKSRDAQSSSADAPESPEMKNLIHQETVPHPSGVPNREDRPMPPPNPTRQPGGESSNTDPNRFGRADPNFDRRDSNEAPRPRTDENVQRPIMPGEPVRPTPQPLSSAEQQSPEPVDRKL